MLINDHGEITPSPIVESVQIRHFTYVGFWQNFFEFKLNRAFQFAGASGGLQPVVKEIMLFRTGGDVFQTGSGYEALIPSICTACHFEPGITQSILSYSRYRFPLPDRSSPTLIETTPALEAQTVVTWKHTHQTWQALETLWRQGNP